MPPLLESCRRRGRTPLDPPAQRPGSCSTALVCGVLIALASPAIAVPPAPKHPMTIDDLWAVQRVGAPVPSPDGRWVAFAVTTYSMEENKGQSDLYLADAAGKAPPRRLTWNPGADASPTWSPDGERLAFVSKRGEDPAQLYLLRLDGGEAERITDLPVAVSDPQWFPDGRRIAFAASTWPDLNDDFAAVEARIEARKKDKTQAESSESRLWRYWDHFLTDGQVPHLFAVDLATRQVTDLLPGSTLYMDFDGPAGTWDISPDGSEIAFTANVTEAPHRTLDFDVLVVPTAGGAPRRITADNPADDLRPRYTPDGRFILYGRTQRPEIEADFLRLVRYDRESRLATVLTPNWDAQPSSWSTTPDSRTILFHAQERGRVHLYGLGIDGGIPRLLVRGGSTGNVAVASPTRLFFQSSSFTAPDEIWMAKLDGNGAQPLTHFNDARVAQLDLGTVRDVTFAGADGDPVQMFVVLPPGYEDERRVPLLHAIHGGPHGAWSDGWSHRWNAALFASRGFAIALVNFHGSSGAGQQFCESIVGAHGDKPFTDIMKATDWLIEQGIADSTRMAAAGGSYGGYLVDWILGHTDRFRALVSHAGVYDLMGQFASDATWGRPQSYGAAPWEDPRRIEQWSPNQYAAHFSTPTLILHGGKDYRVPATQGMQLYGVLAAKGVPARIVYFPDENHWILKPQASRLWHEQFFGWIEHHTGVRPRQLRTEGTPVQGAEVPGTGER